MALKVAAMAGLNVAGPFTVSSGASVSHQLCSFLRCCLHAKDTIISRHVAGFNCMSVIMVSSFFLVFLSVSGCDSERKTMCIPEMAFFLNGCKHIAYLNIKDILSRVARDFGSGEAFCP
jgi:hypothetical protein